MVRSQELEELTRDECLARLKEHEVGRVAFVANDGAPVVLPVNFRLVETASGTWIALRTRPESKLERAELMVAFEIDEVDRLHHEGWSVLVRGTLHHVYPDSTDFSRRFDPHPWLAQERDSWLIIDPFDITGRRLRATEEEWSFDSVEYLSAR
jgi:nitroimidazol reductase NimA-like FMN-containing flavoprotein (pyridoxamine 5'-phosphate oxidase superfamily)